MGIAFVLLNCEMGTEKAIIDELKTIEGVKEVHATYGAFDILVKIEAHDPHKLRETITYKIRKMNQIRATITLIKNQN